MRLTDVSIITRLFRPLGNLYKARKHNLAAKKWLYRNCRGICNDPGPRPSLRKGRRLGLGQTIEQTTGIPVEQKKSKFFAISSLI